jgi:hypothetical protein
MGMNTAIKNDQVLDNACGTSTRIAPSTPTTTA